MSHDALITTLETWLIDQALDEPQIVTMFRDVCESLFSIGIPVARSMLSWPTLHPLIEVEAAVWRQGQKVMLEQFAHREQHSEEWDKSPFKHLLSSGSDVLRRRLAGPLAMLDFPLLKTLSDDGYTDYLAMVTGFHMPSPERTRAKSGIIISWASARAGGFTDADIVALRRIQRAFAVACRTAIQETIAANITETYLGRYAGRAVLAGNIRRGDGATTKAVILYSDLRDSTTLAETLPGDDYLALLNDYFDCSAGSAIDAGGEVLDFIGDAVLAVFPLSEGEGLEAAMRSASDAVADAVGRLQVLNRRRRKAHLPDIRFGISASVGTVMFGNIGVPSRLSFSVVGPAVNAAARIEKLTKDLGAAALATAPIAGVCPTHWRSVGPHRLEGMGRPVELYQWIDDDAKAETAVA